MMLRLLFLDDEGRLYRARKAEGDAILLKGRNLPVAVKVIKRRCGKIEDNPQIFEGIYLRIRIKYFPGTSDNGCTTRTGDRCLRAKRQDRSIKKARLVNAIVKLVGNVP